MEILIALWASLSPGIMGASVGIIIESKVPRGFMGRPYIAASTGGLLGYIAVAFFSYQALRAGISPYTPLWATSISILAATVATVALFVAWPLKTIQRVLGHASVIGLAIAVLIIAATYQHLLLPVQGWDVIDFWGHYAQWTLMEPDSLPQSTKPHPVTIVLIQAWAAWCAHENGVSTMILAPWLFITISLGLGLYGYALWASQSQVFASFLVYCFLALPLIENHMLIAGYAEIFLTATCVISVIWLQLSLSTNSLIYAATGMTSALLAIFIKNTGLFYCAAIIFSYMSALLFLKSKRLLVLLGAGAFVTVTYSLIFGFSIDYFGLNLSLFMSGDSWVLRAAGWTMPFSYNGLGEVLRNEKYSLLVNMSFGVIALLAILSFLFMKKNIGVSYIIITSLFLLFMLGMSQLFFDYGFKHAIPASDTGNSRFTLPLVGVLFLLLPHAVLAASCDSGRNWPAAQRCLKTTQSSSGSGGLL